MIVTGEQVREARRLLGWSQVDVAFAANASPTSVDKFESGKVVSARMVRKLRFALETAGVEFIAGNGGGVRLRNAAPKEPL